MEIALNIAVAVLSLLIGITVAGHYHLRAQVNRKPKPNKPPGKDGSSKKLTMDASPSPPGEDTLEIPAALVGVKWKAILERLAPTLGMTPVDLLRTSLAAGLTGGRPITTEMLDILEEMVRERENELPSKPGSPGAN